MTYKQIDFELQTAARKLESMWRECWGQARDEIRGNWQEPDVMARSRVRAEELVNERLKNTKVTVQWEDGV